MAVELAGPLELCEILGALAEHPEATVLQLHAAGQASEGFGTDLALDLGQVPIAGTDNALDVEARPRDGSFRDRLLLLLLQLFQEEILYADDPWYVPIAEDRLARRFDPRRWRANRCCWSFSCSA